MSHPTLRPAISPERDKRWSLEQRSPLAPIQSLAPAKQHHVPQALSLYELLSHSCPLLRGRTAEDQPEPLFKSPAASAFLLNYINATKSSAFLTICCCLWGQTASDGTSTVVSFRTWSFHTLVPQQTLQQHKEKHSPSVGWLGSTEFCQWFLLQPGRHMKLLMRKSKFALKSPP